MSFRINDNKSGEQREKYGTPSGVVNVDLQSFLAVLHSSGCVLRCLSLKRTMGTIQNTFTPDDHMGEKIDAHVGAPVFGNILEVQEASHINHIMAGQPTPP